MTLKLQAFAKINLTLDVLYKRPDGYHEVAMVMQAIDLADELTLSPQEEGITLSTDSPGLETDGRNLACRAASLLREHCGLRQGVHIHINKKIPVAAGLAGGSADAAATLKGLNRLWELNLPLKELALLGAQLGSDVPFCLYGKTMLATGRGEYLRPLPPLPECWVVLAKPPAAVATAWVYANYRNSPDVSHPDTDGLLQALAEKSFSGVAARLGNVLETVTIPAYPEIVELKNRMLRYGAAASLMSGSGPTVFGLTDTYEKARGLAGQMEEHQDAIILVAKTPGTAGCC